MCRATFNQRTLSSIMAISRLYGKTIILPTIDSLSSVIYGTLGTPTLKTGPMSANSNASREWRRWWLNSYLCPLHDTGDIVPPVNHSQAAAALLKPYVSEKNYWIVLHYGLFQGYYWMDHCGEHSRDALRNSPHYEACVEFCERWDQTSFDPKFETKPLEHFLPVLKRVLSRPPALGNH